MSLIRAIAVEPSGMTEQKLSRPLPKVMPYYRIMDENAGFALQAYYESGVPPEPFLMALLTKQDHHNIQNPYKRDAVQLHRWIQQWMPKTVWGSKKRVERWCDKKEDT
jgi:hypothetical protein